MNLTEPQELQALYHNKHGRERTYWPGDSVWLSGKHIKIKKNLKIKHKYLGPFEILEAVRKQAYKLQLPSQWRIHSLVPVSLLKRDITRREAVDQKIADQLEFEKRKQPGQEVNAIIDIMVFAEEAIDGRLPGLYYFLHWKGETDSENTWEPLERIAHLRRLVKKYHIKNPEKPTATSPPVDNGAPPPHIATRSEAKVAPPTSALICSFMRKRLSARNRLPVKVFSTSSPNRHPPV